VRRHVSAAPLHHQAGFNMIELVLAVFIACTMMGFAVLNLTGIQPGMRADAAMNLTVAQLRHGREYAVAQRRSVEIQFLEDNKIRLLRADMPAGNTILSTVTLENSIEFRQFGGIPDSPDHFGNNLPVDFGGAARMIFLTDGSLVDAQGNPLNGSIFLGLADHPESARAVTVLGATGRVRGYRWTRSSTWVH
jgi:Tfp pilus assembly protein FimT